MSKFLYELINGLSISEKVYFKRNTKIHNDKNGKNYLKIYNAIDQLKRYEEGVLADLFKGTNIEKYLSSEVNYLKDKILLSLFNFNLNRSKRSQIQKGILIVEVLLDKGFRKEALKKLKFIKKSAMKQEEFTWILRLIELEETILFREGIIGYKDKLEHLRDQRNKVTKTIQNLNDYRILREGVREFQFSEHLDVSAVSAFKDLCNNSLVKKKSSCTSIKAEEHWYYIQVLINYLKRDFKAGLTISSNYVQFMYQNLHLFDLNKIMPVLSNYIYHAALTKDRMHFESGKKLLLKLSSNKEVPQSYLSYILYTRSLEFAYYRNDLQLMNEYLILTIDLLEHQIHELEESQIQYLFMVIVRSAVVLQEKKKGTYFINQWLQRGVLPYRKVQARLFSIMIHFELNYLELVQSEIIILKKLAKKNPRERLLINTFYSFLNSLLNSPHRRDALVLKFQKELQSISINIEGYFDLISFDYYKWSLTLR